MNQLRLCFVGNMLGRNKGYLLSQGQIVADLFADAGYEVISASSKINRVKRLAEILAILVKNSRKTDVVVLDVYSGANMLMAEAVGKLCKLLKLPLVMVLHGGELPEFFERNPRTARRIFSRAACLVAPSDFLAEKFRNYGFKVRVVPNVLDLNSYPYRRRGIISEAPRLIWMRSFHPVYNPQMAVAVLAKLKKTFAGATLVMAGLDKGLESETKKMAVDLEVADSIRFSGFLDHESKLREFADADIYLNTNRSDNMPVAVLEACAMGLPVVATTVGGLPFLIKHEENGLLVPNEDASAMAQAIKTLIERPEITEKLSRNGRLLAERSEWANVRGEWEQVFDDLIKTKFLKVSTSYPEKTFATEKHFN